MGLWVVKSQLRPVGSGIEIPLCHFSAGLTVPAADEYPKS